MVRHVGRYVAAFALLPMATAEAVDLINEDAAGYVVFVSEGDASTALTVQAGETLGTVCHACVLEIEGAEPLYAEGDTVVVIRNGKLMPRT